MNTDVELAFQKKLGKKIFFHKYPLKTAVRGVAIHTESNMFCSENTDTGCFEGPYYFYFKVYLWFFGALYQVFILRGIKEKLKIVVK